MGLDEVVSHDDSLAKKAVAFFRMSRSIWSRLFSARRRRSSSSRAGGLPRPGKARSPSAARACFQPRSRLSLGSRSRATSATLWPCSVTSSTAWALNSGVNVHRASPSWVSSRRAYALIWALAIRGEVPDVSIATVKPHTSPAALQVLERRNDGRSRSGEGSSSVSIASSPTHAGRASFMTALHSPTWQTRSSEDGGSVRFISPVRVDH